MLTAMSLLLVGASYGTAIEFPGRAPMAATATVEDGQCNLENAILSMSWQVVDGRLRPSSAADRLSGKTIPVAAELFTIVPGDGSEIRASELHLVEPPRCEDLPADANAVRASCRQAGKCVAATLADKDNRTEVRWRAVLRDGSNYVRQELTVRAMHDELPLAEIVCGEFSVDAAQTAGSVRGSPAVAGNLFFACESPFADNRGEPGHVRCSLPWNVPIKAGNALPFASVVGVAPAGQMRRAFLYYVERERARTYQPFLHYNSWYDISSENHEMSEDRCLEAIERFGVEMTQKRGVRLASFVFDDGWDDPQTLWGFHAGFPNGFAPLRDAAARFQSSVGVWMSPWGGYATAKEERLKHGQTQGFESNARGFSLAGPRYYARFCDVCRQMIGDYGVNFLKFDGIGAGKEYGKLGAESLADMAAMARLTEDLRQTRPDLYISLTIGSWPSPYWLWHGDSVWRNGSDWNACGEGSVRQRWITYRDANTQEMVLRRAPLFPLNSVMNQGITCARVGAPARMQDDLKDIVDEIRMFFGDGTQVQELYVSPKKFTPAMWDALAEAAAWSRDNADVLVDTHWIGGDAGKGEPYGYASWSPRKGILCLRNPSSRPQSLTLKLSDAFELPQEAPRRYALKSPWKTDLTKPTRVVAAEAEDRIELQPFEVLVLEAMPQDAPKP